MKKTNKPNLKAKKATKSRPCVKCYLTVEDHKAFMKKAETHGTHASQWVRHQIKKWIK